MTFILIVFAIHLALGFASSIRERATVGRELEQHEEQESSVRVFHPAEHELRY